MGALIRVVIILIVIWLAWRLVRNWITKQSSKLENKPGSQQAMQPCATCGTYIPVDEAIHHNGKLYCSHAHIPKKQED